MHVLIQIVAGEMAAKLISEDIDDDCDDSELMMMGFSESSNPRLIKAEMRFGLTSLSQGSFERNQIQCMLIDSNLLFVFVDCYTKCSPSSLCHERDQELRRRHVI